MARNLKTTTEVGIAVKGQLPALRISNKYCTYNTGFIDNIVNLHIDNGIVLQIGSRHTSIQDESLDAFVMYYC